MYIDTSERISARVTSHPSHLVEIDDDLDDFAAVALVGVVLGGVLLGVKPRIRKAPSRVAHVRLHLRLTGNKTHHLTVTDFVSS